MSRKIANKEDVVHRRYHVVIALSNMVLCAVGIICILTVMVTWFQNYIEDEMTKMGYTQLSNAAQSVQSRLDYYQMQLQNLFQEPQIKASLYTNEAGPIHEFGIYRFLNYSIVNDGVIDYAVIYKDSEIKQLVGLTYPGKKELDTVVELLNQSQNDREIYQYYNENSKTGRIYLFRTERDVLNGPPKRGLLFAVNQEKMAKSLFSETDEASAQNVWVFDSSGNVLLQHVDSAGQITDEVWNRIYNETAETATYKIKVEDENCFLLYLKMGRYQLNFVELIDTRRIDGTLRQVLYITFLGVAIVLAFCSAASFALAKFILYPLREFFQSLTVSAGLAGKNEENAPLTLITSERILSEISSMSRQLHTDQVLGYLEDAPQGEMPPNRLRLQENEEAAVLVFVGSTIGRIHRNQLQELREQLPAVFSHEISAELYTEENRCYSLLILTEKNGREDSFLEKKTELYEKLKLIFGNIRMSEGGLYAIFSEKLTTASMMQTECRNLKELSKYILFGGFETISCTVDYGAKVDEEISKKPFAELISVVRSGDDVRAKSLMPGLLDSVSQHAIKRIFYALSYLAVEIEQVYDPFSLQSGNYQRAYLEHYIKLTSLINQKELYDYFSNLIEDACLEIRTSGERSLRTTMLDSIQYIDEHYMDSDLSVDQISAVFHISNSYFSRMFNEICNLSFPEYVNELRLNHSAQLLQTTNLSIKEIAARSGFSGVSYFGAQFKRKYGVSPTAYRGKKSEKT